LSPQDNERPPQLDFVLARGMGVRQRLTLVAVLLGAGLLVQLTASISIGFVVFFVGCLFGAVRGRKKRPQTHGKREWQQSNIEGLRTVLAVRNQARTAGAKTGAFNPLKAKGCGCLLLMILTIITGALFVAAVIDGPAVNAFGTPFIKGGPLWPAWVLDMAALLIVLWFSGQVSAWQPDELLIKAGQLLFIAEEAAKDQSLEVTPSLEIVKAEHGDLPTDARLLIKPKDAPEGLVGIQVQTSLNSVQGTNYPYTYCVMLAKPEMRLSEKAQAMAERRRREMEFGGAVIQVENQPDMDVVVVRQQTGGGGYKTSNEGAWKILAIARELLQRALAT
jgi:hypothetical protein